MSRTAFGKPIANLGGNRERIADARIAINHSRLLVMHAAWLLDQGMSRAAYSAVSEIKVEVPNMALDVIDMAMQMHGGGGCRTTSRSPRRGWAPGRCGWPTDPTRCTAT